MTSPITKTSAERMGLAEGKEVSTVIKASNVIVALE
jgi:molybdopterin-binding protein